MKTFTYRYVSRQGDYLGEAVVQSNFHRQHAFFCSTCGEIWMRIYSDDPCSTWEMNVVPCENHLPTGVQDWAAFPGSILHEGLTTFLAPMPEWARTLDYIPDAILKREFLVHLQHYDKQIGVNHE